MTEFHRLYDVFGLDKVDFTFSRLDFWIFFIVVLIAFTLLKKHKIVRNLYLIGVSFFFYYKTSGLSVFTLLFSIVCNYSIALWIDKSENKTSRRIILVLGILLNVFVLSYFKYAYFFTNSFNELFHTQFEVFNVFSFFQNGLSTTGSHSVFEQILLPAGVSFFTFSALSYIIDVYRKENKAVKNFIHLAFFLSFFPRLILGPIMRAKTFIPQIVKPLPLNKEVFGWSIFQILKGFFKKLILADFLAVHFIDLVVESPDTYPGFVALIAIFGYSLQIYGDFSGYMDMAAGIARLLGYRLDKNFNLPYKSLNTSEYWHRWHITLGKWWKDYLYIPLGGNRTGGFASILTTTVIFVFLYFITQWNIFIFIYTGVLSFYFMVMLLFPKAKKYIFRDFNLIIVMTIGGLWHNPLQNYVIWGAINGIGLIVYKYWKKISPYEHSSHWAVRVWKIFTTFSFITFARIWFRIEGKNEPFYYFFHMINHWNFSWSAFALMCSTFTVPLIVLVIGLVIHWLPEKYEKGLMDWFIRIPYATQIVVSSGFIILLYQLIANTTKPFIYFAY